LLNWSFFCSDFTVQYLRHSRSVSFFSHFLVGDCVHPVSVRRQYKHTDASVVYARRSALLDLPGLMRGRQSSSASQSFTYSMMNVRISTVFNISSGKSPSLNFYSKTSHHNNKLKQYITPTENDAKADCFQKISCLSRYVLKLFFSGNFLLLIIMFTVKRLPKVIWKSAEHQLCSGKDCSMKALMSVAEYRHFQPVAQNWSKYTVFPLKS